MFALFLQSFVAVLFPECVTMLNVETRLFSSYGGDLATGSSELGELETSTRQWKDAVYLETPQADNVR